MAMAMQPNLHGIGLEVVGGDAPRCHLTHDELVEQQGVTPQLLGLWP